MSFPRRRESSAVRARRRLFVPRLDARLRGNDEPMLMTPQTFIQKWGPGGPAFSLNEEQGAQSHFLDLCELLDVPKPGNEAGYRFEEKSSLIGGRTGYADVFRSGVFAWKTRRPAKIWTLP